MRGVCFLLIYLCLSPCLSQSSLETYPVANDGEDEIVVEVTDNDVSIYCRANESVTEWYIDGSLVEFNASTGQGLTPYTFLSVADDLNTLANLTVSLGTLLQPGKSREIDCRFNEDVEVFLIGKKGGPKLKEPLSIYNVTEGNDFLLDLKSITHFPPYNNPVTSTWLINGSLINDSRIITGVYNITVLSVWRSLSGMEFNLTVRSNFGFDTKRFKLNVQFPPEAETVRNNVTEYGEVGGSVRLLAVIGLRGNPSPTYRWFNPSNMEIIFEGRFLFPSEGELHIDEIMESDFGNYVFDAMNEIESPLVVTQMLKKAVPPGRPTNVEVSAIEDESVVISWSQPSSIGMPPLTMYSIELLPGDIMIMTGDNSSTTQAISKLLPGTLYNVTVTAVSSFNFIIASLQASEPITFKTLRGVPRIDPQTSIGINNGQIMVSYILKHTGGFDPDTVSIEASCGAVDTFKLPTREKFVGSGESDIEVDGAYSGECLSNCLNHDQLTGSLPVSGEATLSAGVKYICVVIASNSEGDFYYNTTAVVSQSGISSIPIIMVTVDPGVIVVTIQSEYPGVASDDTSFFFTILVTDEQGNQVYNMTFNGTEQRMISINVPIGVYYVQAYSGNVYGTSDSANVVANVTMEPSVRPTENESEFPLYAVVAIAVGGTLLIFCIFITIIIAAICINYKRKKDSVSFYKSKYEMTIKRY